MTAVYPMLTRQTRRSWISVRFLPLLWRFYCRVDIVRSTASLWILLGVPFSIQELDGNEFKRFATLSMDIFNSTAVGVSGQIRPFLEFLFGSAMESLLDGWFPLFSEDAIRLP